MNDLRRRAERDSERGALLGCIVATPVALLTGRTATVGVLIAAVAIANLLGGFANGTDAAWLFSGLWIIAFPAVMFALATRWTFVAVRASATPVHVQVMWLRKFDTESRGRFRLSKTIDRLGRYGIAALTLQDRVVRFSSEQRLNRMAPLFWLLALPVFVFLVPDILAGPGLGSFSQISLFVAVFGAEMFLFIILLSVILHGPTGALFSRRRDDFNKLPNLLDQIKRGDRKKGTLILRISDENWRDAVSAALVAVEVSIIDVSEVSESICWEIAEAVQACPIEAIVFLCREQPNGVRVIPEDSRRALRNILGADVKAETAIFYPAHDCDEHRFGRQLSSAIYRSAQAANETKLSGKRTPCQFGAA